METMTYKNDIPEGERRKYYANGSLYNICSYKNGKLDGEISEYHEDGSVIKLIHGLMVY